MRNNYQGKTNFEVMLVMLLLIMFVICTYTLVLATTTSYEKTQEENLAKDNLELASSYVDSKTKQFKGKNIKILNNVFGVDNAISLEEDINNQTYQTIIYFKEDVLREAFVQKGTVLKDNFGFEIASLKDMKIENIDEDLYQISFYTKANKHEYKMQTILNTR